MKGNYLAHFCRLYFNIPPQALWRAIEAELLSGINFVEPILDLGSGDGVFAKAIFGRNRQVSGVDLSPENVRQAHKTGVYQDLRAADARSLPYADGSFRTVFSNCVLEHVEDEPGVLAEISRVLAHGGNFVFTVPSERFCNYVLQFRSQNGDSLEDANRYLDNLNARLQHLHYHSPEDWQKRLEPVGLSIDSTRYYLQPEAHRIWLAWTEFFIKRVGKTEIGNLLRARQFAPARIVLPVLWRRLLGRCLDLEIKDQGEGAALLIRATKRRS